MSTPEPDPRQQVRDLIAAKITGKLDEWGVGEPFPEDQLADAVMELFDGEITDRWEVRGSSPEWGDGEWSCYPKSRDQALTYAAEANAKPGTKATAYRVLELRTTPEPIEETP